MNATRTIRITPAGRRYLARHAALPLLLSLHEQVRRESLRQHAAGMVETQVRP